MASDAAPAEIDGLYEVQPAGFVQARNALVKSLKAAGKREQADQVAQLSRPTASLWATNQVARRAADLVARLAEATARLQGGGVTRDREKYAAAINHHRDLLNEVRARIEEILADAGLRAPPATVAAAVQNFRSGLMDSDMRSLLLHGRLPADVGLEAGGGLFGLADALGGAGDEGALPPAARAAPKPHEPAGAHRAVADGGERARREEALARRERERALAKARAEAERQVHALRKAAESASAAREKQEFAVASARRELAAAERSLAEARSAEQEAAAALTAARSALERMRG